MTGAADLGSKTGADGMTGRWIGAAVAVDKRPEAPKFVEVTVGFPVAAFEAGELESLDVEELAFRVPNVSRFKSLNSRAAKFGWGRSPLPGCVELGAVVVGLDEVGVVAAFRDAIQRLKLDGFITM